MINRVGKYTLYRSIPNTRTLSLTITRKRDTPPQLGYGWVCFFIAKFPSYTRYSYKKGPLTRWLIPYEVDVTKHIKGV